MPANIAFNPMLVTNAAGSFYVESEGYVQGTALDSPAVRFELAGGVLALTETIPMWGGVGIFEHISGAVGAPANNLGNLVGRAANEAAMVGFSVFNQMSSWITTPTSEAPTAGAGMSVHFYRFGSGARIAVKCDPALVSLQGGPVGAPVAWDFTNQMLIAGTGLPARVLDVAVGNSKVVTYDAVNNLAHWDNHGTTAIILI